MIDKNLVGYVDFKSMSENELNAYWNEVRPLTPFDRELCVRKIMKSVRRKYFETGFKLGCSIEIMKEYIRFFCSLYTPKLREVKKQYFDLLYRVRTIANINAYDDYTSLTYIVHSERFPQSFSDCVRPTEQGDKRLRNLLANAKVCYDNTASEIDARSMIEDIEEFLSDEENELFQLMLETDFDVKEIARITGRSKHTLYTKTHELYNALKSYLRFKYKDLVEADAEENFLLKNAQGKRHYITQSMKDYIDAIYSDSNRFPISAKEFAERHGFPKSCRREGFSFLRLLRKRFSDKS